MFFPQVATGSPAGLYKRTGIAKLNSSRAPRGLFISSPLSTPAYGEVISARPVAAKSGAFAKCPFGVGFALAGGAQYISYQLNAAQPSTRYSVEALIYLNSTATGSLCGWDAVADGSNGAGDRKLAIVGGAFQHYTFGSSIASGGTAIANRLYHLVGTADGSTNIIYVNGANVGQTGAVPAFTGYTNPYFVIGQNGGNGNPQAVTGTLLLVNFTANATWSPSEVAARYADPFGFLSFPEDTIATLIKGGHFPIFSDAVSPLDASLIARSANERRRTIWSPG